MLLKAYNQTRCDLVDYPLQIVTTLEYLKEKTEFILI